MNKLKLVNKTLVVISLLGVFVAYIFGELFLLYFSYLPYWLQCGIYLSLISLVCCLVMGLSGKLNPGGYLLKHKQEFRQTSIRATLLLVPVALVIGIITQLLYGLIGLEKSQKPDFQGTMVVSDISSSMADSDRNKDAIKSMTEYIKSVPLGEYLGVTLFNQVAINLRDYTVLQTEVEREELISLIRSEANYSGNTDIQSALMGSMSAVRSIENTDWPGLVLLFSDGLSPINYKQIQKMSIGDIDNTKTRIPVNTIYFANSPLGGYQMSAIAQRTGGTYFYIGSNTDATSLKNAFMHSRSIFNIEKPHLLRTYYGPSRASLIRITLQILFILIWGIFTGLLVVVFLNNKRLVGHYLYAKIVVSVIFALLFTLLMVNANIDNSAFLRLILLLGMCIILVPTYTWGKAGDNLGMQSDYKAM